MAPSRKTPSRTPQPGGGRAYWGQPYRKYPAAGRRLQCSLAAWCPPCYLRQQRPDSSHVPLQFFHGRAQPRAQRFRQSRVRLLQRQRLGDHMNLLAAPRVQPFPEPPLAAAVSPKPLLSGPRWAAIFWFCRCFCILFLSLDHIQLVAAVVAAPRLLFHESPVTSHESPLTTHFFNASSFSPLICPSGSTRPVTRIVRVSFTRSPYLSLALGESTTSYPPR